MNHFKTEVEKAIYKIVDLPKTEISNLLEIPADYANGDYAFPCFKLAKLYKKNPKMIAEDLADKVDTSNLFERVVAVNGYVNFYVNKSMFIKDVLSKVLSEKDDFGSNYSGKGKTILVEHTSINPNASPHIGRARNAMIGDALVRLLKFEKYNTEVHYFVNDIGKQIAMLVLASENLEIINFSDLLDMYVNINSLMKEDSSIEKRVFSILAELENGNEEMKKRFRNIVDTCIDGQCEILNNLGISYDIYDYESQFVFDGSLQKIINKLEKIGKLFEDENGRYLVDLSEFDLIPLVITRQDKTSLYPLRDIAYTIYKIERGQDGNIIVLGEDQKLYFRQVAAVVTLLGYKAPEVVHYSFVNLAEGKMSTRQGTVVLLEDLMEDSIKRVSHHMKMRGKAFEFDTLKTIGYSSIKYSILKISSERNVTFDWDSSLSFEGDSAVYMLYTYARINSILKKYSGEINTNFDQELLENEDEFYLVKEIDKFNKIINDAVNNYSTSIILKYAYSLAKSYSRYYSNTPILNAESPKIIEARVVLSKCVSQVIKNALFINGINTVDEM